MRDRLGNQRRIFSGGNLKYNAKRLIMGIILTSVVAFFIIEGLIFFSSSSSQNELIGLIDQPPVASISQNQKSPFTTESPQSSAFGYGDIEIFGPARIIEGDTLEIDGQLAVIDRLQAIHHFRKLFLIGRVEIDGQQIVLP